MKRLLAEAIGTFGIVTAVSAAGMLGPLASGSLTEALAVAGAVMAMMFALGHVSGGHFNPAITLGLAAAGRRPIGEVPGYVAAQLAGGALAAFLWFAIANARAGSAPPDLGNFFSNGFGAGSPGNFALAAVGIAELVATALLVLVYAGVTSSRAVSHLAPIAVGAAMIPLLLLTLPISGGGLNPARSSAMALFGGGEAIGQLWLFWVAPLAGAILGGLLSRLVHSGD